MKNNSFSLFYSVLFQSVFLRLIVFIVNLSFLPSFSANVFSVSATFSSPLFLSLQFLSYHSSIIIFSFSGKIFPFFHKTIRNAVVRVLIITFLQRCSLLTLNKTKKNMFSTPILYFIKLPPAMKCVFFIKIKLHFSLFKLYFGNKNCINAMSNLQHLCFIAIYWFYSIPELGIPKKCQVHELI